MTTATFWYRNATVAMTFWAIVLLRSHDFEVDPRSLGFSSKAKVDRGLDSDKYRTHHE